MTSVVTSSTVMVQSTQSQSDEYQSLPLPSAPPQQRRRKRKYRLDFSSDDDDDQVPTEPSTTNAPSGERVKPPCNFVEVESKCEDCGMMFKYNSTMPSSSSKKSRCPPYFDKHVKENYVSLVHENRESGAQSRTIGSSC